MKKALIVIIAAVVLLIAGAAAAVMGYLNSDDFKGDKFHEGTTINGVDCSNLSYDEAKDKISEAWNNRKIVVTGALDEPIASFTDFGCKYDIEDQLKSVKEKHLVSAALNHYLDMPFSTTVGMKVSKVSKDFEKKVKNADFLTGDDVVESQNAYVDTTDPSFPIIKEVYGTKPDSKKFFDDLIKNVEMGNTIMQYQYSNYMSNPEVKSDDPQLLAYQQFCKDTFSQKITYEFGKEKYTIPLEEMEKLFKDDMSGDADKYEVQEFVKELAEKYDTAGEDIRMTSLTGKTFNVNGGTYGWIIDQEAEEKQLEKDLEAHKDVSREPKYSQEGEGEYSSNVGDTYVDVDITEQEVVYFVDGKKKFKCDCVTGCELYGHDTPTGVFYLNNKSRNVTLVGGGKKGSAGYYESFVNYWMSFVGSSVGLHDASWRSSFGGEIYKTSGSHGCVNLPVSKAGELYDIIEVGVPVIVHY